MGMPTARPKILCAVLTAICLAGCEEQPATTSRSDTASRGMPSEEDGWGITRYGNCWSVIIGINQYADESLSTLSYAENDAQAVHDVLIDEFGYDEDGVELLTGSSATRNAVKKAFEEWLPAQVRWDDSLLVFFAGHGTSDGHLACYDTAPADVDTTGLSVNWLRDQLYAMRCRHRAVILDSCYSGALFRGASSSASSERRHPGNTVDSVGSGVGGRGPAVSGETTASTFEADSRDILYYLQRPAVLGIAAARETRAIDAGGSDRHSVFTAALLTELYERAGSDRSRNAFTFSELALRIRQRVGTAPGTVQIPTFGAIPPPDWAPVGDGDFIFVPTLDRMTPRENERIGQYISSMQQAKEAARTGQMALAQDALNRCPVSLKNWEWHFLKHQRRREVAFSDVTCMAFDPNNGVLAAGCLDEGIAIQLWDMTRPREPRELIGHNSWISSIHFGPDEGQLISFARDGNCRFWDLQSGSILKSAQIVKDAVSASAFHSKRRIGALGSDDGSIRVIDMDTGNLIAKLEGNGGAILDVKISPDGTLVAAVSVSYLFHPSDVRVWRIDGGDLLFKGTRSTEFHFTSLAFHPSGRLLAVGAAYGKEQRNQGSICIWDIGSGKLFRTLRGHPDLVTDVEYSHDGQRLFSLGGELKIWHAVGCQEIVTLPDTGNDLYVDPGGRFLAVGGAASVKILDGTPDREVLVLDATTCPPTNDVALSPNGRWLATAGADSEIRVWDTRQSTFLSGEHDSAVRCVSFSSSGQLVVSGDNGGLVKVWDAVTLQPLASFKHTSDISGTETTAAPYVADVALSPDGIRIASVGYTNCIQVWDWRQKRNVFSLDGHEDEVRAVAFSPDGRYLASGGEDKTVRIWDAETGDVVRTLTGHTDAISAVAFGKAKDDVSFLMSASYDRTVKIWNIPSGHCLVTYSAHPHSVWSVAVGGNAGIVASADNGPEGAVRIWRALSGADFLTFGPTGNAIRSISMSEDGRFIAAASLDDTVRVWNVADLPGQRDAGQGPGNKGSRTRRESP